MVHEWWEASAKAGNVHVGPSSFMRDLELKKPEDLSAHGALGAQLSLQNYGAVETKTWALRALENQPLG